MFKQTLLSTQNSTQEATRKVTEDNATFFVAMSERNHHALTNLWQSFGQKVRERREELGLTQTGASKRAKMKRQQWNRIEQGASTKRSTLFRIADALELKPEIVLDWAGFKLAEESRRAGGATVEETLDNALFFERMGFSEADREQLRPLLQVVDREVTRLKDSKDSP